MTSYQIDTTGGVPLFASEPEVHLTIWLDLSPFTQGYIEALFQTADLPLAWDEVSPGFVAERDAGFRHLAPETLARIIADCAERLAHFPAYREDSKSPEMGALFWARRQHTGLADMGFPPLTVQLGDDGKVRFQEQDQ